MSSFHGCHRDCRAYKVQIWNAQGSFFGDLESCIRFALSEFSMPAFQQTTAKLHTVPCLLRVVPRQKVVPRQQVVASRLATLATVQHTLDLYCAKLCGKSDSFRLFSLHPFGSTALGLCEQESDLDVCAVVHPEAFEELIQRSDLAEFKRCTSQQQAKHFLRNVLSPALDAISVEKKEVLEARVPVLRLSLRQVLDTMDTDDEQRVDVTLSDEGPTLCQLAAGSATIKRCCCSLW